MTRIRELDALRGMAAVLVVHFHYTMGRLEGDYWGILGITGVDLFFMISGFVIFMSLATQPTWQTFLRNRLIRIYPSFWIAVSFTAVLTYFNFANVCCIGSEELTWEKYFANLTMFQFYFHYGDLDGPYWTLLIEMQYYLLVALVLMLGRLKRILLYGVIFLSFPVLLELVYQPLAQDQFKELWQSIGLSFQLTGHFPFFFAGMLFYKVYSEGAKWSWIIGICICFLTAIMLFDNAGRSQNFIKIPQYLFTTAIYFGLFILLVRRQLGFIVHPITLFLGRISYPLYLIHQFMGISLIIPWLGGHYGIHYRQAALISFGISIFLAFLVTRYVEEPCLRSLRQRRLKNLNTA